jgi:hypothetical protein
LFSGQTGIEQESGHPDDPIHGGTNFMAHDGEEGGLGLRGCLSLGQGYVEAGGLLLDSVRVDFY